MYYPIQLPHLLNNEFDKFCDYQEETIESLQEFVICFWQMRPKQNVTKVVQDIVLIDGCTELVVNFKTKWIGFLGPSMSQTSYGDTYHSPGQYIGVKLKPGAFTQLTGLPVTVIQEQKEIQLSEIDKNFDPKILAPLTFEETKEFLRIYFEKLIRDQKANEFVKLFDELIQNPPPTLQELYEKYHFSPRQCQRYFKKYFGITPQMVLLILRFQFCLHAITTRKVVPADILNLVRYSDQSHFIRDFKKNTGLTPFEYLQKVVAFIL
jgi:AraC-like DNA-binding protein